MSLIKHPKNTFEYQTRMEELNKMIIKYCDQTSTEDKDIDCKKFKKIMESLSEYSIPLSCCDINNPFSFEHGLSSAPTNLDSFQKQLKDLRQLIYANYEYLCKYNDFNFDEKAKARLMKMVYYISVLSSVELKRLRKHKFFIF